MSCDQGDISMFFICISPNNARKIKYEQYSVADSEYQVTYILSRLKFYSSFSVTKSIFS